MFPFQRQSKPTKAKSRLNFRPALVKAFDKASQIKFKRPSFSLPRIPTSRKNIKNIEKMLIEQRHTREMNLKRFKQKLDHYIHQNLAHEVLQNRKMYKKGLRPINVLSEYKKAAKSRNYKQMKKTLKNKANQQSYRTTIPARLKPMPNANGRKARETLTLRGKNQHNLSYEIAMKEHELARRDQLAHNHWHKKTENLRQEVIKMKRELKAANENAKVKHLVKKLNLKYLNKVPRNLNEYQNMHKQAVNSVKSNKRNVPAWFKTLKPVEGDKPWTMQNIHDATVAIDAYLYAIEQEKAKAIYKYKKE